MCVFTSGDVSAVVALGPALKFNGGGHINHSIFWQNMSPNGGGEPSGATNRYSHIKSAADVVTALMIGWFLIIAGELMDAIKRDFGSFQNLKDKLSASTVAVQGSGWGWLGYNKDSGRLQLAACSNQDPLQATTGNISC